MSLWTMRPAIRPSLSVHGSPSADAGMSISHRLSSSWINQVERFFALLTEQQIKRGAHRSAKELENAIATYIDSHNADPKPFRWTKSADDIVASIARFCRRTVNLQAHCA